MIEKESEQSETSSISVLNLKDDNTNVTVDDSVLIGGKNGDSYNLTTLPDFLNKSDTPDDCVRENSSNEKCALPVGYQTLPEEFFNFGGIPPPLVSISWLKLLNESDEESGEDLPLSKLKNKLQKKKKKALNKLKSINDLKDNESNYKEIKKLTKRKKLKISNEFSHINRKRGRPRKCEKDQTGSKTDNDVYSDVDESHQNENDEEYFWNDQSESPDVVIPTEVEVANEKDEDNSLAVNHIEHDYFKSLDVTSSDVKDKTKEVKKKKERNVVQGIKTGDSKISFPCKECGKSFSAASTLKSHLRIHNGTLLICTECHRGFTTKYLLKCHMRIHNGDLFMCHKCGKGFTTAELLKVHSRGHTGDRPFFCNICKRSFPSASNLSQHKQTHNPEKKFLCFQCGSSFSQKRCLDGHMLTHAEKNHICNVCGKLWARKSDLSEHMRVHTGVKPYCCNLCPQKFTQASSLKRHRIVHMDLKPIQCLTCSKMFKCQEYYKRHLRKHEKEADYLFSNVEKN